MRFLVQEDEFAREKQRSFSEEESHEVRKRGEQIDRKLNGLMNALRGKKRITVEG